MNLIACVLSVWMVCNGIILLQYLRRRREIFVNYRKKRRESRKRYCKDMQDISERHAILQLGLGFEIAGLITLISPSTYVANTSELHPHDIQ